MAQHDYSINLKNATFPLLSEDMGHSIIVGSNRQTNISDNADKPHIYYCENVLPTREGMGSANVSQAIFRVGEDTAGPYISDMEGVRVIYGDEKTRLYLGWDSDQAAYAIKEGSVYWTSIPDTSPSTVAQGLSYSDITTARVNGITYIWYKGIGCFTYDETTDTLVNVTLTGLTISEIIGVTASSGYLIAYTATALAWSSTVDPTDFTPDPITGAGGGEIPGIGGDIKFGFPNPTGILLYSDTNVISASYTGNITYPFKFREVAGSKGLGSSPTMDLVAFDANSTEQYAITTAGLQAINAQKATTILPEVSDFIQNSVYETFNTGTGDFSHNTLSVKKIRLIGSRYLVISYGGAGGSTEFAQSLVYDIALDRLGKIKQDHVDVVELVGSQAAFSKGVENSIGFVYRDGTILIAGLGVDGSSTGVMVLGRLQYTRGRHLHLLGAIVDKSNASSEGFVKAIVTLDGKNVSNYVQGTLKNITDNDIREYYFNVSGKNISLALLGYFNVNTVTVTFKQGGSR